MILPRREFLRLGGGAAAFSFVTPFGGLPTSSLEKVESIRVAKAGTQEEEYLLNSFVREISEYDIIHFGETHHSPDSKESTTLEDVVRKFLPRLRSHEVIRTDGLPYEFDSSGKQVIPLEELVTLNRTGIIDTNTPTINSFMESYNSKCKPRFYGIKKLVFAGNKLGYELRGLMIPPNECYSLVQEAIEEFEKLKDIVGPIGDHFRQSLKKLHLYHLKGLMSEGDFLMSVKMLSENYKNIKIGLSITANYIEAARQEMRDGNRLIMYGWEVHNDYNDSFKLGIADEMRREFPGRYVAIDLVKRSATKPSAKPFFLECYEILRSKGLDPKNLDHLVIIKTNDPTANYVVFLPQTKAV